MAFSLSLESRFDAILKQFCRDICTLFPEINYDQLLAIAPIKMTNVTRTCFAKLKSGPNKGKLCTGKPLDNGYCGKHQNSVALAIGEALTRAKANTAKKAVGKMALKTQQQITEWLNTAVPQDETVLKKCKQGLLHEETDILFNNEYIVIGMLNKNNILKLGTEQIETCERHGWQYDPNAIDPEL